MSAGLRGRRGDPLPSVRKEKKVKLNKVIQKIIEINPDPERWDIQIMFLPDAIDKPPIGILTVNLAELYKDWWGEAKLCPENGEYIKSMLVVGEGQAMLVDSRDLVDYSFGEFMDMLHERRSELELHKKGPVPNKRMVFDSHGADSELNSRSGYFVEVLRELTEAEADIADVGRMFHVRFLDGFETDVFEDELVHAFQVGDKVRISYISDCNPHNNKAGVITSLRNVRYYPGGDESNPKWRTQGTIAYEDGSEEGVGDMYRKGSGLVAPVELIQEAVGY